MIAVFTTNEIHESRRRYGEHHDAKSLNGAE